MKRLKTIYVFLFVIILGLLILPQFKLKVGDTELSYPNIDFSLISSSATLGNFSKGYGLYDSKIYAASIQFEEGVSDQVKEDTQRALLAIIKNRAEYSNLSEVNIYGSVNNGEYFVNLQFPEHISESDKIAQYLVASGNISFLNDPQVSTSTIALTDKDIVGPIKSIFNEQYGNVLQFKFSPESSTNLYFALQNEQGYFLMNVDSSFFAIVQDPNFTQSQSADLQNSVIAVPFADLKLSPNVAVYTNIVRTYFLTPALTQTLNLNTNPTIVKRDFVADRLSYIALLILLALIAIVFIYFIRKGKNKGFQFALMLSSYLVLTIFLLKLQSAVLSVSFILGFVLSVVLVVYLISKLLSLEEDIQYSYLKDIFKFTLFLALSVVVFYKFIFNAGTFIGGLGVLIASALSIMFLCIFNFKYILDLDLNIKLRKRK